ncbi:alpha/beta hydrolase fold protein [Paenibacillus curdlanolyticus YK9]|uniref:Alpha/beta hydrolase fold protein n=1 Tax=Paenibacillus curdlanolyticus YK9 TaxID=717606 RepID=E0I8S3_9BACL|nr:alpha/beta hydrolase [Paenibacillus curdlanolyticus]EFM10807.1 alpha/beta hydrolase fold protein [Paenibacillus curdlanolyticus YK9]
MENRNRQSTNKDGFSVEYSIVGEGEPVLVLHGGHSNCDEELGYNELIAHGYAVITPSRPGYGRTSKELGRTIMTACDAYIELLDALHIAQVHVIAISAGGPSGIHLASRYPTRVKSLVLQSAVAQCWLTPDDQLYKFSQIMFRPSIERYVWGVIRVVNRLFPSFLFKTMIASLSKLPKEKVLPQISSDDRRQFRRMLNRQRSGHGFLMDLAQTGHDLTSVLVSIHCPTLILHSIHDAAVPLEHARNAHQQINDSQLWELDSWGHLIWLGTGADGMYERLFTFLKSMGSDAATNRSTNDCES